MRLYRTLRREPACLRIEDADPVGIDIEDRKASPQVRVVEELVLEIVRARTRDCPRYELTVWPSHVQATGLREQGRTALALELAPEVPRAFEQRDVARVLVVGEPDDPREPAERRGRVSAREAIEAEHALSALRE